MAPRLAGRIYAQRMTRRDGWMFDSWALHCSPAGNDTTGDGTFLNPFFSPGKAAAIIHNTAGGYTVFSRGGSYSITADAETNLHVGIGGSVLSPFVFREFPGERVKLVCSGAGPWTALQVGLSNFVTVRGFEILLQNDAQGITVSESSDCAVESNEIWSDNPVAGQVGIHVHSNQSATGAATDRNVIRRNHIHDIGQEALYIKKWLDDAAVSVDSNIFESNLITGTIHDEVFQHSSQVSKQLPSNTIFRNNIIRCTPGDIGGTCVNLNGTVIDGNIWIGSGGDYGAIYVSMDAYSTIANVIRNNLIVWSSNTSNDFAGIIVASGHAAGILDIYHNTVNGITNSGTGPGCGILIGQAGTYNVKNNILSNSDTVQMAVWGVGTITRDYNNIYPTDADDGTHAENGDPVFANATEYQLSVGSPAGVKASGLGGLVAYDLFHRPRNAVNPSMGCHEYP
jgi:hypothetical protein